MGTEKEKEKEKVKMALELDPKTAKFIEIMAKRLAITPSEYIEFHFKMEFKKYEDAKTE